MSAARHAADDASFRASLLRQGGGAVAVLAASALVFWGIGALGGGPLVPTVDDGEVAAPEGTDQEPDDAPADEPEPEPEAPAEGDADDAEDAGPDDEDTPADEEPAPEPEDDEADEDEGDDAPAIDPASVTVQVLDGYKSDGGAAAGEVADLLDGAGYRIVARNQAIDYAATTVLFNPGNEAAAAQIARDLGGAEVRAQPGNLSTQVAIHVVVGADRA